MPINVSESRRKQAERLLVQLHESVAINPGSDIGEAKKGRVNFLMRNWIHKYEAGYLLKLVVSGFSEEVDLHLESFFDRALARTKAVGDYSLDGFIAAVRTEESLWMKKPKTAATTYFLFDARSSEDDWATSLLDCTLGTVSPESLFEIASKIEVGEDDEPWPHREHTDVPKEEMGNYRVVGCTRKVRDDEEALYWGNTTVDLFRSALNASLRLPVVIAGDRSLPLARHRPNALAVVQMSTNVIPAYNPIRYRLKGQEVTPAQLQYAKQLLDPLKRVPKPGSVQERLRTALSLFGTGIDASTEDEAFFGIWRCFETLAGSDNNAEIASRLSTFFEDDDEAALRLRLYADLRNRYVHRGEFVGGATYGVAGIANVATACLRDFRTRMEWLKTWDDFSAYYTLACSSEGARKRLMRVGKELEKRPRQSQGGRG